MVGKALDRHPAIFPSALPQHMLPPAFKRYSGSSNAYGRLVDNAVSPVPETGTLVRTDISCTLFLSGPASYSGGELLIVEGHSEQRVKLPASHLVLHPNTRAHEMAPVTRGERLAGFFWIKSMVRNGAQRRILLDMDVALNQLRQQHGDNAATVTLPGAYHQPLRMWASTCAWAVCGTH
jgi:PKHD-type hydroxylase